MPSLLGSLPYAHPSAGKRGRGPEPDPETCFPAVMESAKLCVGSLATNEPPAFPSPYKRLCSKNRAVAHPLEACPNQTVFPCFLHPCHMLHRCGARGGSRHTRIACKNPITYANQLQFAHVSRATQTDPPSFIGRSTWVHNHRFTFDRPTFIYFTSSPAPLCLPIPTVLSYKSASFLANAYAGSLVYWLVSKLHQASYRHSQLFEKDSLFILHSLKAMQRAESVL